MAQQFSLGEPEFFSPRMIRNYCENGRKLLRPLYHELHVSAEEMEMVLKDVPSANPQMLGQDSKVRARFVAKHLRQSAQAVEVAAASLARTYQSFRKHYVPEATAKSRPRRQFRMDDQ